MNWVGILAKIDCINSDGYRELFHCWFDRDLFKALISEINEASESE